MKHLALQEFVKHPQNCGKNSVQLLSKFMLYASECCDPLTVFKYMEEKSICIFLTSYWTQKAQYFAQVGDYLNCFGCLKEAASRVGIIDDENQKIADPCEKFEKYKAKLMKEMQAYPIRSKRTLQQYNFLNGSSEDISGDDEKLIQKLLSLYTLKYQGLRKQKETIHSLKLSDKPPSWLFDQEQRNEEKARQLQAQIHSNTNSRRIKEGNTLMSLQTPLKRHDPMRLTKTVDSVEMLKRKKSTIEKSKLKNKNMFQSEEEGQDEYNGEDSECDLTPHTVPVGKKFTDIKRRVTFDRSASYKFEKIRNDPQQQTNKTELDQRQLLGKSTGRNKTNSSEEDQSLQL